MLSPTKASILCFPQRFEAGKIHLNFLFIPREDPLKPLITNLPAGVDAPAFSEASLKFSARLVPSLEFLPQPSNSVAPVKLTTILPGDFKTLFLELKKVFNITLTSNELKSLPKSNTFIQKYLPLSYRNAFDFSHPRSPKHGVVDDAYLCALKKPPSNEPKQYTTDQVSWGKVFALALRQPVLARRLGMLYSAEVILPQLDFYKEGGWIYIELADDSDFYQQQSLEPLLIKKYAARIPALSNPRSLFSAVQFLVTSTPQQGNFDALFEEAASFDDGFANIVHCTQPHKANMVLESNQDDLPPIKDLGIRIGWEDEQILDWANRLLRRPDHLPASTTTTVATNIVDAPLGILSYRIDVRNVKEPPGEWHSLNMAKGQLKIGDIDLGPFTGELGVEVAPIQLEGLKEGAFWLPSYFAQWDGASVVLSDERAAELFDLTGNKKMYEAVVSDTPPLRYGETYEFRVRLSDMTGSGPLETDKPNPTIPSQVTSCRFRRFVPPAEVRIPSQKIVVSEGEVNNDPPSFYEIFRPLLSYPNLLYTNLNAAYSRLKDDIPKARAERREPGYPDPDVTQIKIDVLVEGPQMDVALSPDKMQSYYPLFSTTRNFPDDPEKPIHLSVSFTDATQLKFGDAADLGTFPFPEENGELILPSARKIKIAITPLAKPDPTLDYFGSQEARHGRAIEIITWADSKTEPELFIQDIPAKMLKAILLQPDQQSDKNTETKMQLAGKKEQTPNNLISRLADALQLHSVGLNLFSRPGERVVFGCCKQIGHTLSPEHGSIQFNSKADLLNHWIVAAVVKINRDWSWNGLAREAIKIRRDGELVGIIEDSHIANETALEGPQRDHTTFIFFDAIDPKPRNNKFPEILNCVYTIEPSYRVNTVQQTAPLTISIRVPVAVKPAQVPKIVSAGIALSSYDRDQNGYSWSRPRSKMLWLEFEEPVLDPNDAYFVYVKANAPDPKLMSGSNPFPEPKEVELYTDPEYIRVITPGQSEDKNGLNERQQLIPSRTSDTGTSRHFLLPLPNGLSEYSPELFGFFVYDICVGHANIWCTAQSRYGRSIRVTGVQHPAPSLICSTMRDKEKVVASAPHAYATYQGSNLTQSPTTELWGLLYAQVTLVNGEDHRNILLARKRMYTEHADRKRERRPSSAFCDWSNQSIIEMLDNLGLKSTTRISCMAVEMFPNEARDQDPLGADLGYTRILRVSQLEPVAEICCVDC